MMRRLFPCLVALPLLAHPLAAQDKAVDVFVLSSHSASSEWQHIMTPPMDTLAQERPDLNIVFSNLPFISYDSVQSLEHDRDSVLDLHALPPRLVILLGGSCFSFAPHLQERWPGIPMLLIGEQDYYCDLDYTLHGPGSPSANRYPIAALKEKGLNLSLVCAPPLVRRTLEMILRVQPQLEKLIFVAGENYLSKERQWRLEQLLRERYPQLSYQAITSADATTDQLLTILEQERGPKTAVYFGSWLVREGYWQSYSTRHNTVSLIEHITPVYTLFANDLEKHPYVVGFYSYSQAEYNRTVRQRILDVLDLGIDPREIPFSYMQTGIPTLNYRAMEHFGLDPALIPRDAVVFNRPYTLWEAHKGQIMWLGLILLLGMGAYTLFVMGRSLRSLRQGRIMAENASKMKTAFIQNMSHEVRTPLNAITGFSQLLCMPDGYISDDEKAEYLSYIMNNSQLLTVLVNDMLDIADMENGRYAIHETPTNLNEVARLAIKAVEYRIPAGVNLIRKPGIPEDALYVTDGMRVQQILINFLTNACKYGNGTDIVIGSSLTEIPGYVTFYVADHGPGVPVEEAESIFERFIKLDRTKQGAGLGLSICRMVAQSMQGKVWLDTGYTEGARFILAIPAKEA